MREEILNRKLEKLGSRLETRSARRKSMYRELLKLRDYDSIACEQADESEIPVPIVKPKPASKKK